MNQHLLTFFYEHRYFVKAIKQTMLVSKAQND